MHGQGPGAPGRPPRRRASELLLDLARAWPAERITIGDLLAALGDRGYGLLILALALPNLIPVPMPGVSGILGTPIILLSLMMLAGYPEPVLPRLIRERSFPRATLEAVMLRAQPWLARIERITKPGTLTLPSRAVEIAAAILLTLNAILLALPIPFGNPAPAVAIILTAMALVEADRRMFLAAIAAMIAAIVIDIAIVALLVGLGKAVVSFL
ncbi:exopolysaccharide biosynthesis protein [Elioraea sp.]|uniref:exopolysaccharide biosynthesis protein n=1 Tax=Elioraea sp. TaxID=2185103 RepID=UPI0025BA5D61|nr:exopolysaccharide biosynthesis protein [Elioraea sp.]